MSDWDKENLGQILMGHGDWFDARLLRLISKADRPEMEKLHQVFPEHVEAVYERQNGKPFVPSGANLIGSI